MAEPVNSDQEIWSRLVEAHVAIAKAAAAFLGPGVDRVSLIRRALHNQDRTTALYILPWLKEPELTSLFEDLLWLASFSHGGVEVARRAISSLPREWVLSRIEADAESLLRDGDYDQYWRLLELYILLDRGLTLRLASRAAAHPDRDISEAGEDFLNKLSATPC